ncbi:hypothetical protein Micbo1qcDRAFT_178293 [Microdochium bolleyi]|uniref:C2H2-type domain-containing protein n=1 Tax=Microdochium bolleyi TaxID=196109 RepID=A0A136ITB6_9PEZI|nr:hypothetical protein Micbo1qcDRAFT_178293 [Microdochium bolleyi]
MSRFRLLRQLALSVRAANGIRTTLSPVLLPMHMKSDIMRHPSRLGIVWRKTGVSCVHRTWRIQRALRLLDMTCDNCLQEEDTCICGQEWFDFEAASGVQPPTTSFAPTEVTSIPRETSLPTIKYTKHELPPIPTSPSPDGRFYCGWEGCANSFRTRSELRKCVEKHFKRYQCDYCLIRSGSKKDVEKHIETHSLTRDQFECRRCSSSFTLKYNLQKHERRYHGTGLESDDGY